MKKLIIACAAVLVLGLGLTTVGHVLGGQFYSVYYNGALHPFSDAAQNFSDKFVNISDHIVTLSPLYVGFSIVHLIPCNSNFLNVFLI